MRKRRSRGLFVRSYCTCSFLCLLFLVIVVACCPGLFFVLNRRRSESRPKSRERLREGAARGGHFPPYNRIVACCSKNIFFLSLAGRNQANIMKRMMITARCNTEKEVRVVFLFFILVVYHPLNLLHCCELYRIPKFNVFFEYVNIFFLCK